MSGLTNKQRSFIEEYLCDFNATRAAERAGYGGDDNVLAAQGSRLLRNVKVAEKLHQRLTEAAMGADEVLTRLAEQARGLSSDYFKSDGELDAAAIVTADKTHLIKKTKRTRDGLEVELYDAQTALEKIGRAHGLFIERHEQSGEISIKVTYDGTDGPPPPPAPEAS